MRYASTTTVSTDRSRAEIERILTRYGADQFAYGWEGQRALIGFRLGGKLVKLVLALPSAADREFTRTAQRGSLRTVDEAHAAWERACRQRWRALKLIIQAKLEAIESGITTLDEEFLAHTVLPSGQTAGEWLIPQVADAYQTGAMPTLLPQLTAGSRS
jgi:hypothetical protein